MLGPIDMHVGVRRPNFKIAVQDLNDEVDSGPTGKRLTPRVRNRHAGGRNPNCPAAQREARRGERNGALTRPWHASRSAEVWSAAREVQGF